MLKDRQKKQIKKEVKDIDKQIDAIESNIDKIRQEVDEDKAKAYADEGASGLIDNDIKARKEKLFDKVFDKAGKI
jgi:peptidoglycan hydrolase CwlO-like protein